ncbi:MAG: glutathione S-transferase [Candidatus Dactylopiibacterium carminicum]|uniref:Glutathione S-transferase n=1 Tax=Candidatus Dactylopiibacterium carminicum TaxID=857335 RepID=A0A272EYI6_9RHOO|nr:glutathione S-transferase [Candidatus Dactylopiibacterium carminicum]KAF7600577.1 glutathione S-transferase [Candidatus Dactylopiibacterium carminicum]PAS94216.1 MAG: glutathione S-transferase [Candidatus Dactylopiibacterium carminicum]PAS95187.1 MAG: glutathione S-transferase [Candidatus Dactylopiibacterium carminicum]PAT00582.1 MAG: glutathione S-transferase [Candidatus Dactylopiibacterium carminicum]
MKLIASLTSPFARKIRVLLLEKGQPFDLVVDSPYEPDTCVTAFNPLGKVPTLVTEIGEAFFDSPVIADFIDLINPAAPVLPTDALDALHVRQLEALADGVTEAGVIWLTETRRPAERQDANVVDRQLAKLERGMDALVQQLGDNDWLRPDGFSRADIAAACCLLWLDFRLPQYAWRNGRPTLAAYAARLSERPSFAQTVPVA